MAVEGALYLVKTSEDKSPSVIRVRESAKGPAPFRVGSADSASFKQKTERPWKIYGKVEIQDL